MSLVLVRKNYGGTVVHWFEEYKGAICGQRAAGRAKWHRLRDQTVIPGGNHMCPKCAKIKAARDQQRQDITEGLMVAQAVEASRYEP